MPSRLDDQALSKILRSNSILNEILERAPSLGLPNWYIAAGAVSQTYWNHVHNFDPLLGIKDYDLVYFDKYTSYKAEDEYIQKGKKLFASCSAEIEIRNQARVHLWYPKHFGRTITPYTSVEDGISSWATTITCIGINNKGVFAPFGLEDLRNLVIRPNKKQVTKSEYERKAARWKETWPKLSIIPW